MEEGLSIILKLDKQTFNAQAKQILDDATYDFGYAQSLLFRILDEPENSVNIAQQIHDRLHKKCYNNAKLTELRNHIEKTNEYIIQKNSLSNKISETLETPRGKFGLMVAAAGVGFLVY